MFQFNIPFILGSIFVVFVLSTLINYFFLRHVEEPKKDIISILAAYNILGGIMVAFTLGERLVFAKAYLFLAPAAIIVLIVQLLRFKYNNKQ